MTKKDIDKVKHHDPYSFIREVVEAMEKQLPKKVTTSEDEYCGRCPECGCDVTDCLYCKYCGQRLDWSGV